MPAQDNTDKGLREEIANAIRNNSHYGVAETPVLNAVMKVVARQVQAAQNRLDVNTWTYMNAYRGNCACEACVEISKQNKRIAQLQAAAPTTVEGK